MKTTILAGILIFLVAGCATFRGDSDATFDFWQRQMPNKKLVAVAETSYFSDAPQRVVISTPKDPSWLETFWGKLTGHKPSPPELRRYDTF